MTTVNVKTDDFAQELLDRRSHLLRARRTVGGDELDALVADIDAALARIDQGTYEICTVCHESIGAAHLASDPLARCCAEHPTAEEIARISRDLALARRVQLGLLPPPDHAIDGWRLGSRYETAAEVGGDFYDVIALPARRETLVIVGDVSGKGMAASLMMASLVATFRSLSSVGLPAGELLSRVNDLFHGSTPASSYATLAALSLRPGGQVDLYSAGHWPPLLRSARSATPVAVDSGLPLGLFAGSEYRPTRLTLAPSDTLLVYTDGAIDAEDARGGDYGWERLARTLESADGDSLDALVTACLNDVRRFQDGGGPTDDLLMVAVRAERAERLDRRMTEQELPPLLDEPFERRRRLVGLSDAVDRGRELLGRIELAGARFDAGADERAVGLDLRAERRPVERVACDVADVLEIPRAKLRHGQQLLSQRLVGVVG